MQTPWADTLERAQPLPEYPRPQMVRDSYLNLNGPWSYAITTSAQKPAQADGIDLFQSLWKLDRLISFGS